MMPASQSFKFKSMNTLLHKLTPDYEKSQKRSASLLGFVSDKVKDDLAVNSSAAESLCVEVLKKNSKSIVLSLIYRTTNGDQMS